MSKINPGKYVVHLLVILVAIAVIYASNIGRLEVLVLSSGVGLICYGLKMATSKILFFVVIATFLGAFLPFGSPDNIQMYEGFKNQEEDNVEESEEGFEDDDEEQNQDEQEEAFENEDDDEEKETFENEDDDEEKPVKKEGFANQKNNKKKKKRPPPNNRDSKQMFELGKKYNIPSEGENTDDGYHLDVGTTFINAYKSLKPDQVAAMTKDTQELIDTQKQLMSTLNSLKPLMTDGKQIMDTFQNYFGGTTDISDLTKLAEKFSSK